MKLANVRTMREAVDLALQRFVQIGRQRKVLELYGNGGVSRGYDYKRTRSAACKSISDQTVPVLSAKEGSHGGHGVN